MSTEPGRRRVGGRTVTRDARSPMARAVLALGLAAGPGCGVPMVGLAAREPPVQTELFSRFPAFTPVDRLDPTLRWDPLDAAAIGATGAITDITYEVRVWSTTSGYSGDLVYARQDLAEPLLHVETPLAPATKFLWTVRAKFRLDGDPRTTEWGMAASVLRDQAVPNASCFRFETPPAR